MCTTCHKEIAKEKEKRRYNTQYIFALLFAFYDKIVLKFGEDLKEKTRNLLQFSKLQDGWRISHILTLAISFGKPSFGPIGIYRCEL